MPFGRFRDIGIDVFTVRRIDIYLVSFYNASDEELSAMGVNDITAVSILIGLREASDADGKTAVVLPRFEAHLIVFKEQVGKAVQFVVDEPDVVISCERLFLRQVEGEQVSFGSNDAERDIDFCRGSAEEGDTRCAL